MSDSLEHEIRTLRAHFWSDRDPDGRAFAPLAEAYLARGDLDEALALVTDGLGRLPDFATGHLVAARVHRARGDTPAARQAVESLLALDGGSAPGLRLLGEMAEEAGQVDRAVSAFRDALMRDPGYADLEGRIARLAHPTHPSDPTPDQEVETEPAGEASPPVEPTSEEDPSPEEPGDPTLEGFESFEPFELPGDPAPTPLDEGIPDPIFPEEISLGEGVPEEEARVEGFQEAGLQEAGLQEEGFQEEGLQVGSFQKDELPEGLPALPPEDPPGGEAVEGMAPGGGVDRPAGEPSPALVTRTMAELYVRQGFIQRALGVYRQLAERDPGDQGIRERLEELEAQGAEEPSETSLHPEPEAPPSSTSPEESGSPPGEPEEPSSRAPQWSPDPGSAPDPRVDSPFAWAPHEHPDEAGTSPAADPGGGARAPSAGAYFRDLLAWEPGAVPIESLAPRSGETEESGEGGWPSPDATEAPLPPADDDPFIQLPPDDGSWGR